MEEGKGEGFLPSPLSICENLRHLRLNSFSRAGFCRRSHPPAGSRRASGQNLDLRHRRRAQRVASARLQLQLDRFHAHAFQVPPGLDLDLVVRRSRDDPRRARHRPRRVILPRHGAALDLVGNGQVRGQRRRDAHDDRRLPRADRHRRPADRHAHHGQRRRVDDHRRRQAADAGGIGRQRGQHVLARRQRGQIEAEGRGGGRPDARSVGGQLHRHDLAARLGGRDAHRRRRDGPGSEDGAVGIAEHERRRHRGGGLGLNLHPRGHGSNRRIPVGQGGRDHLLDLGNGDFAHGILRLGGRRILCMTPRARAARPGRGGQGRERGRDWLAVEIELHALERVAGGIGAGRDHLNAAAQCERRLAVEPGEDADLRRDVRRGGRHMNGLGALLALASDVGGHHFQREVADVRGLPRELGADVGIVMEERRVVRAVDHIKIDSLERARRDGDGGVELHRLVLHDGDVRRRAEKVDSLDVLGGGANVEAQVGHRPRAAGVGGADGGVVRARRGRSAGDDARGGVQAQAGRQSVGGVAGGAVGGGQLVGELDADLSGGRAGGRDDGRRDGQTETGVRRGEAVQLIEAHPEFAGLHDFHAETVGGNRRDVGRDDQGERRAVALHGRAGRGERQRVGSSPGKSRTL